MVYFNGNKATKKWKISAQLKDIFCKKEVHYEQIVKNATEFPGDRHFVGRWRSQSVF